MEIAYAFVARAGEFTPDGTFSVIGGDFSIIRGNTFPLHLANMTLLAKLVFSREDSGQHHEMNIDLVGEDNQTLIPPAKQEFDVPSPADPENRMAVHLALMITGVQFPRAGNYRLRLLFDGQEIRTIKLQALELTAQEPAAQTIKQG